MIEDMIAVIRENHADFSEAVSMATHGGAGEFDHLTDEELVLKRVAWRGSLGCFPRKPDPRACLLLDRRHWASIARR
jgi:hypothetical protein